MRRGRAAACISAIAVAMLVPLDSPREFWVAAGGSAQEIVDRVPDGWTVRLGPGEHVGPLTIDHPVEVVGDPGATVAGGESGIAVRGTSATIRNLSVTGADLHGVDVEQGSVHISSVVVRDLRDPYAQGIEIRNSLGREPSEVRDSVVVGGQEGIVAHVSEVVFADNIVGGTTLRAISITEMSKGIARSNLVSGARGVALYCGDMSHCELTNNRTTEVQPGPGGARSAAGWGLVVNFDSRASSDGDLLRGAAGKTLVLDGSTIAEGSPLRRGRGWATLVPLLIAAAVALVVVALGAGLGGAGRRLFPRTPATRASAAGMIALLAGIVVQTFHMAEHLIQVSRVHADGIPSRGSLVGSIAEPEWVHFGYNSAVLVGLVALAWARGRGFAPRNTVWRGDRFLLAALAIQGYHVVEHVVKVSQHLTTGAKVNPGILGGNVDLVWLHFTVNLAVYIAVLAAARWYVALPDIRLREAATT